MRKYLAFVKVAWQQTLTYRAESIVWFILELISPLVMLNLWRYMFISGKIDNAKYSELVTYYVVVLIISKISSVHFEEWVVDHIKNGNISTSLLKPFSYPAFLVFHELTWRISQIVYFMPAAILLFPLYQAVSKPNITFISLLLFLVLMVIAYLQRFYFGWLISTTAFWIDQSKSLVHFRWMSEGILGGQWLPLDFFPHWWQSISKITPFFYWYYFPVRILQNQLTFHIAVTGFITAILWIISLHVICRQVWAKAVKHYSAFGG